MDGEQAYISPVMTQDTEAEHVRLNIIGAKELKLVVDPLGANAHDHSDWANARFLPRGEGDLEQIEVTGLPEQIQLKKGSSYTPVSYTHLDVYKRQPMDIKRWW